VPFRTQFKMKSVMAGRPYTVYLVDNPTIDDVLVVEMQLRAAELMNNEVNEGHRVDREVRNAIIQLGVER